MPANPIDPLNPLPLYYQVYRSLIERIEAGEFSDGKPLPPERQLTEEYGVSRITVVRALTELKQEGRIESRVGRGTFVVESVEQQARIVPEPAQKSGQALNMLAFICSLNENQTIGTLIPGIAQVAEQNGHHLQCLNLHEKQLQTASLPDVVATMGPHVIGAIVYPTDNDIYRAVCLTLQEQDIPLVLIEQQQSTIAADRIVVNETETAHTLTSRLIEQGYSRIAAVISQDYLASSTFHDRFLGYRRALTDHGLAYNEDLVWTDVDTAHYLVDDPNEAPRAIFRRLWKHIANDDVTAVLILNPNLIQIIIHQSHKFETSQPEKGITFAAFDYIEPPIVTPYPMLIAVHSSQEIGKRAAQLLYDRINGAYTGAPRTLTVPVEIVSRSVAEWTASK